MLLHPACTLADAWLGAALHLRNQRTYRDTTIVLHVSEPTLIRPQERALADTLGSFLESRGQQSHHTVAETIFPASEYRRHGVDGVFRIYPDDIFPVIQGHEDARPWGTYAHRMLRRLGSDGMRYNPLQQMILKMKQKQPVNAAYELDLNFDIDTYDDSRDRQIRLGGPCLSHLSFKLIEGKLHLTATYRKHFYVHRAYGNLLGLARLQAFVAAQVGATTGPLVCHSTLAVLEFAQNYRWGKREVGQLIDTCERAFYERSTSAAMVSP